MITRFKQQLEIPYSLHDMIVNQIIFQNDSVHLQFQNGYISTKEPYPQVNGNITIEEVDEDSVCILLLSDLGKYGDFRGKKMLLKDFLKQYEEYSFEIVDEMYGFHQVEYIGYLYFPEKEGSVQMSLSIYFTGDIVYETEE